MLMAQNHLRISPNTCSCIIDVLIDPVTGDQSLFALRNICDIHMPIATAEPDFENKKTQALAKRYQDLEDNRQTNLDQIAAYTDLQMSPAEKQGCIATIERLTAERKREYDLLLSKSNANLVFCANVHDSVKEESGRFPKIYARVQSQFNLTDTQMQTITWSFSGTVPNRTITVNFGSLLTTNQKNASQNWCDTNLGVGKVIVL